MSLAVLALAATALATAQPASPAQRVPAAGCKRGLLKPHMGLIAVPVVAWLAWHAHALSVALAAAILSATAYTVVRRIRCARARGRADANLARVLGLVVTQLEAGVTPERALDKLAQQPENTQVIGQLRAASQGSTELGPIAAVWEASRVHGVRLAPMLAQAQSSIDALVRRRSATAAALTGPTSTAMILSALPLAGMALGSAMGAHPVRVLCGGGLGGILLVAGTALLCAGVLWSQAIIARAGGGA